MRRCSKERHQSTEGYDLFGHYVLVSVLLDGNIKTNSPHKNSVYKYIYLGSIQTKCGRQLEKFSVFQTPFLYLTLNCSK